MNRDQPVALLILPPVYDFALYDLYLKPYGLLRMGRWLAEGGWMVVFVNGLDYRRPLSMPFPAISKTSSGSSDPSSKSSLYAHQSSAWQVPKRKPDGTGKFLRRPIETPKILESLLRPRIERGEWKKHFARYGIPEEELQNRIRFLAGEVWDPIDRPGSKGLSPGATGQAGSPHLGGRSPNLILISTGMTYWYLGVEEAVRICRQEHPTSLLVVGGIYATLMPDHCARITGVDGVIQGEDLSSLRELLARRGLPVPSGPVPDKPMPFPSVWNDAGVLRLNTGCPLRCSYCASHALTPRFRAGDPSRAWDAFWELYQECGTRNFAFYDDALLYRKEEVLLPFLEKVAALEDPSLRFYLPNGVHVRGLDLDTARLMKRAGVVEIRLGLESTSEEFHRRYDGKVDSVQFLEAVSLLKQAGYEAKDISVYVLAGLPGQEAEEVESSIRFVKPTGARVRLAEYSPVPSTQLWKESARQCSYPLEEEPLFHNNSLFILESERFPYGKLLELKRLAGGEVED